MRTWLGRATALMLGAAPTLAQDMTPADCASVAQALGPALADLGVTGAALAAEDGWCVARRAGWETDGDYGQRFTAETLRLRGSGLDRLARFGLPDRLDLEVDNLSVGAKLPDALMSWVFEVQGRRNRIDLELSLAFDPAARTLTVARASADFPGDNRIALTATLSGVDFSDPDKAMVSMGALTVPEARLEIETNGLFEWWALMPLATMWLPPEGDIDAAMDGVKAQMTGYLNGLPDIFAEGGREALIAAIGDLPAPSGTLTVTLSAGENRLPGLAWMFLMEGVRADWPAELDGLEIGAAWVRTPEDRAD